MVTAISSSPAASTACPGQWSYQRPLCMEPSIYPKARAVKRKLTVRKSVCVCWARPGNVGPNTAAASPSAKIAA
jgi:hypothetical protein